MAANVICDRASRRRALGARRAEGVFGIARRAPTYHAYSAGRKANNLHAGLRLLSSI